MRGDEIGVVSGLPRCGTSMMMRMLEAGGIPVLVDGVRAADADNPNGYYEFERVKQLKDDAGWLAGAGGKVVKMVSALLPDLPVDYRYRVVFMQRNLAEILASQRTMLERKGHPADGVPDERRAEQYERHLASLFAWLRRQDHLVVHYVHYNDLLADPPGHVERLDGFFGGGLDTTAMLSVVDATLYRQRA